MSDMKEMVSVAEAARQLDLTIEEAYDLVFRRQLRTVEGDTGRRLVPVDAITEWRDRQPGPSGR